MSYNRVEKKVEGCDFTDPERGGEEESKKERVPRMVLLMIVVFIATLSSLLVLNLIGLLRG